MTTKPELDQLDEKVRTFLKTHHNESPHYQSFLLDLWKQYLGLGLPNSAFVTEFTSAKRERFVQRIWEMLLARHLHAQGHCLSSPTHGPDFRFVHKGRVIWVEAISPEPRGVPSHWLELPMPNGKPTVKDVPHDEIALRWTAAFKEKWEKLESYRKKGIVGDGDAYVIAIHGGQLGLIPLDHGISRYPLALEVVFPIGPLAFPIDRETMKLGKPVTSERFSIRNQNGALVPTTPFTDPRYAGVSAVLGYSGDGRSSASLPAYVVHNPLARVSVPFGILGRDAEEWYAEPIGTNNSEFELRKYISS